MAAPFTLGMFRPLAARVMNCDPTDSRIPDYANEVERRLMIMINGVGSIVGLKVCSNSACLAMPRQVETVLAWGLCGVPGQIRDRWYEYVPNGPGLRTQCCGDPRQLLQRDPGPTFDEPWDAVSKVALQTDLPETPGQTALIQGYDGNQQWLTSTFGGAPIDGIRLALSTTLQVSAQVVSNVTRVLLPGGLKGMVRLYQWANGAIVKPLGFYEADEVVPWYRKYLIPGLPTQAVGTGTPGCGCSSPPAASSSQCCCKSMTFQVQLRHIDLVKDTDWFCLQSPDALKLGIMAVVKEEKNLDQEAMLKWQQAVQLLDQQKTSVEGDGTSTILNVVHTELFGGGYVENDIVYGLPAH